MFVLSRFHQVGYESLFLVLGEALLDLRTDAFQWTRGGVVLGSELDQVVAAVRRDDVAELIWAGQCQCGVDDRLFPSRIGMAIHEKAHVAAFELGFLIVGVLRGQWTEADGVGWQSQRPLADGVHGGALCRPRLGECLCGCCHENDRGPHGGGRQELCRVRFVVRFDLLRTGFRLRADFLLHPIGQELVERGHYLRVVIESAPPGFLPEEACMDHLGELRLLGFWAVANVVTSGLGGELLGGDWLVADEGNHVPERFWSR